MQKENVAEEIELELEVPEDEVDIREADIDVNAADQLSLAPEVPTEEVTTPIVADDEPTPEDTEDFSDNVQKRINKLTYQREEAKRREDAAVQYAQQVQADLQAFQTQTQQVNLQRDEQMLAEYNNRITAELETAKQRSKDAYETGDADLIVEANKELAAIAVEEDNMKRRVAQHQPTVQPTPIVSPQPVAPQPVAPQAVTPQPVAPQAVAPQQQVPAYRSPPPPDKRAEDWAIENNWFGEDEAMTHSALGYHRKLVEEERIDPHSEDYYTKINTYMRTNFPHKFDNTANSGTVNNNSPVQTVASASRTAGSKTGRKVKLTASQVAIAKRLGVPLKEYAKYV